MCCTLSSKILLINAANSVNASLKSKIATIVSFISAAPMSFVASLLHPLDKTNSVLTSTSSVLTGIFSPGRTPPCNHRSTTIPSFRARVCLQKNTLRICEHVAFLLNNRKCNRASRWVVVCF